MQLHAHDQEGQIVNARHANRQKNYHCMECHQIVRLRGGPHRRPHFYHLEPIPLCRQHQKGILHLQLQNYFLNHLPSSDCKLELPFPTLGRIADVAWISRKIVFEIQCSPISADEVLARNHDYRQEGWEVIWILHDNRYNQIRLSAAEMALRDSPHFFSNIDRNGKGYLYDQFDLYLKGLRLERMARLPLDLQGELKTECDGTYPLSVLKQRAQTWKFSISGDLMSLFCNNTHSDYIQQAIEKEKKFNTLYSQKSYRRIWQLIKAPYQIFFRFLLERLCR